MVAISAEYRVKSRHKATPFRLCGWTGSLLLRWIRTHAAKLGVDPKRIASGGRLRRGTCGRGSGYGARFECPGG